MMNMDRTSQQKGPRFWPSWWVYVDFAYSLLVNFHLSIGLDGNVGGCLPLCSSLMTGNLSWLYPASCPVAPGICSSIPLTLAG